METVQSQTGIKRIIHNFGRKKPLTVNSTEQLRRFLRVIDLVALGVGTTLGLGVYVLAGAVAKLHAGPAVIITFTFAAFASFISGVCFAELAVRVPLAGSVYVYSYVMVGEFVAFMMGWMIVLEYVIATASVAHGLSNYIDVLANNVPKATVRSVMPIHAPYISTEPDFIALGVILIAYLILSIGMEESSLFNKIFTVVNLATITTVVVAGSTKANINNWYIDEEDIPFNATSPGGGKGGFLPFGFEGVFSGAAEAFFGFVGFDCIATLSEEAINPEYNIPLAIVISLCIVFVGYFSLGVVITMMIPYYEQDTKAPLTHVFNVVGYPVVKWIVTVGAVCALCASLLGSAMPLPRILYAISNDGLLFKFMSKVNKRTKTPLLGTLVAACITGAMALLFDLYELIDLMSMVTLLAYTMVSCIVLNLRFKDSTGTSEKKKPTCNVICRQLFNLDKLVIPNNISAGIIGSLTFVYCIIVVLFSSFLKFGKAINVTSSTYYAIVGVLIGLKLLIMILICFQPRDSKKLPFKVPLVPLIPCLSALVNTYFMFQMDGTTWVKLTIWLSIGCLIYLCYGYRTSVIGNFEAGTEQLINPQN